MKKALISISVGFVLGAGAGCLYALVTQEMPQYQSQAAFADGLYTPILTVYGAVIGAVLGAASALVFAVRHRHK